jgi:cytochrome c oxidase subunit I+III
MSDVTRSVEATNRLAVRQVEQRRKAYPNAVWGVILLVATEATVFAVLFATYMYLRTKNVHWPPPGVEDPKVTWPLVLNGILVCSTVPMLLLSRRVRRGHPDWWLVVVALCLQGVFFAFQLHEMSSDFAKFKPSGSSYASIYFTMLGVHQAHVAIGLLANVWLVGKLARGLTNYRANATRAIAIYWYFVNLMAIFSVLVQVSPSL